MRNFTVVRLFLPRHSSAGWNLGKIALKALACCKQAKHMGGLDSGLRQNDDGGVRKPLGLEGEGVILS